MFLTPGRLRDKLSIQRFGALTLIPASRCPARPSGAIQKPALIVTRGGILIGKRIKMKDPLRQTTILREMAHAMLSSVPLDEALKLFASQAADYLDVRTVLIFWPQPNGEFALRAAAEGTAPAIVISPAVEWVKMAGLDERAVLVHEACSDASGRPGFPELATWAPFSLMCVPLKRPQCPAALMVAINRLDEAVFDEEDLASFSMLADWMSVGLAKLQAESDAELLKQEKTDFVSLVSHEMRVPMTSVKGYAKLLALGTAGNVLDSQKQFLDAITRNVNRMDRLVSVLLDLSRLEAGRVVPDWQVVSLKSVIEDNLHKVSAMVTQKELNLEVDMSLGLPLVYADPDKLAQVVENLLLNACLYTPEKGTVSVAVRYPASDTLVGHEEREDFVEVQVSDTGIGIAEEDRPKVFYRFFRGDHPLVQEAAGTGFSLIVTRLLVELHQGRIGFTSHLGQGSRFTFVLPIAKSQT